MVVRLGKNTRKMKLNSAKIVYNSYTMLTAIYIQFCIMIVLVTLFFYWPVLITQIKSNVFID